MSNRDLGTDVALIRDDAILEEKEAISTGLAGSPNVVTAPIISIDGGLKVITFSNSVNLNDPDNNVGSTDIINILTGPATGFYTVVQVLSNTTLEVTEAITNVPVATDTCNIYFAPGAARIGVNDLTLPGLTGNTVQEVLEAMVAKIDNTTSPGFSFGYSGNVANGTWLRRQGQIPSNRTGYNMPLTTANLNTITLQSQDLDTYTVTIYHHEGNSINLTVITAVSIVASRKQVFVVNSPIPHDRQVAARITSGSGKNIGVDLGIIGS